MKSTKKDTYLQIRLSKHEKELIVKAAGANGVNISKWIMQRIMIDKRSQFQSICLKMSKDITNKSFYLSDLNDYLTNLSANEFLIALDTRPNVKLSISDWNIIVAMIDYAAYKKRAKSPDWLNDVEPLQHPLFATELTTVRQYLLITSPIAFRRRNIFVDTSIGGMV